MPEPRYVWVRTSFSRKNTLKPWERTEAKAALDAFVAEHYRPQLKEPPKNSEFNYAVDLTTRWHGPYLYIRAKYACPSPLAVTPFFERDFVRLGVVFANKWNLWARRYNDEWLCLEQDLTLQQCFQRMRTDAWFEF